VDKLSSAMWNKEGGVERKNNKPPHAKRQGWLKNGNPPGDFTKAPRCGARTRKGTPCKGPAMKNGRCRMHGGTSPGGLVGNQHALKHGLRTKQAIAERKMFNRLLKESKELIKEIS
jgi:hypothetical protein